ncbi:nucleotidyltransferase domain-containing protein [Chryseobacterium scophthalmum]|uniref:Nucleotidyltransferase domain-containing protein n=1 Tax=Chryseobacterium scophthalmum TaxID=59733 RepID=A0A1N6EB33_9FLAO|nr:nucleotidyltransferase domain-containing protein [Chryseobacterium scophthalmum]SIN80240.1 Nucleotidyltransferase domain-containing protein [Chryseobacterium scophthalmum]
MEVTNINVKLIEIIKNSNSQNLQIYLFGSYLTGSYYEDIDILIIYGDYDAMKSIKKKINHELTEFFPHITCLTFEEEIELSFIKKSNAKKIAI